MRLHEVIRILNALERGGVRYAVFGAMAMAAHGLDRATRDLDLFVAADDENIERLRGALDSVFNDPELENITAADLRGDYPVIQYGPPDANFTIDIVSRLGNAFAFESLEIVEVDAGGTTFHVVSPATLYRMKRDTTRPRDHDDAARLRRAFDLEE